MIVRILGEGQFTLEESDVEGLNELDAAVESAIEVGDEEAFGTALAALHDAIRSAGVPVADEELVESDSVLPSVDASLAEVAELLGDEGLIPG